MIELVRMKWAGVWRALARGKCVQGFGGNLKQRDQLEDVGVGWGIILKRVLKK
jgi:hypothetical protein